MKCHFIALFLWFMGSTAAFAASAPAPNWLTRGETLTYRVYWGPLSLGKATLEYHPTATGYRLNAQVKGGLIFFNLEDTWSARGKVASNRFLPREYRAIQVENDYRANKRLTFNHAKKTMLYENLHSNEPSQTIPLPSLGQDPFSALYDLRKNGPTAQAVSREVMGLKRPFTLNLSPVVVEERNGQTLRKVTIVKTDTEKPGTDTWTLWLSDNAELVPVEMQARLKIGSFRAVLISPTAPTKQARKKTYGVDEQW